VSRIHEISGVQVRWTLAPVAALADLEPWWQESLALASRDPVFRGYLEGHSFRIPEGLSWAASVAIAVIPLGPRILPFVFRGRKRTIVLPSPYYQGPVTRARVGEHLEKLLAGEPGPARVQEAPTLPSKPLAASCGLGRYGRNGLVYVDGLGTAHALAVFWTSVRAEPVPPLIPTALPCCSTCGACIRACPTGAISDDFGPIIAHKCVALWNELDRDLPETFPPGSSHALVGCLACQTHCPANGDYFSDAAVLSELTEEETRLLLAAEWQPGLAKLLTRVLSHEDEETLQAWAPVLRRNLRAYLQTETRTSPFLEEH